MANPQTIIRDGSGAQVAEYQLPPGLFQYIESVLVEVDNGAAGDVRPTLKVETVNGQVMATKRQGEAIPAGDTGTATWALRLDDERAASSGSGIQFDVDNVGNWLFVETTGQRPLSNNGVDVRSIGAPLNLQTDGLFTVQCENAQTGANSTWEIVAIDEIKLNSDFRINLQAQDNIASESPTLVRLTVAFNSELRVKPTGTSVKLPAGGTLDVLNSLGNPIFRVNENGDLQGLTGKALTFNL